MSETPNVFKRLLMASSFCNSQHRFCLLSEKALIPSPPPFLNRMDGMPTKIKSNIYALHNFEPPLPLLLFKERQQILITSLGGVGLWKIKKGSGTIVQGQVFLKGRGWHFSYLILSRFIVFKFRSYFILCKIALYFALCHHNFKKKSHSKLSKNEPKNIPYKLRFISLFVKGFKRLKIDFW